MEEEAEASYMRICCWLWAPACSTVAAMYPGLKGQRTEAECGNKGTWYLLLVLMMKFNQVLLLLLLLL